MDRLTKSYQRLQMYRTMLKDLDDILAKEDPLFALKRKRDVYAQYLELHRRKYVDAVRGLPKFCLECGREYSESDSKGDYCCIACEWGH